MTRLVVVAVVVVAAFAAADAIRRPSRSADPAPTRPEARLTRWRIDRGPTPCRSLVPGACGRFRVLDGAVVRDGRRFLEHGQLAQAFPGAPVEPVVAFRVARRPDGVLAVAVLDRLGRGALEIWSDDFPVAAFRVPAASFRAGLGWTPRGDLVAAYPRRGRPALYDLRGRHVGEVAWTRRPG